MTAREIFKALLTELSKVNAPSMLLEDFNYYMNRAVNQYINKRYNIYDINQQTSDDLRVLKATATLTPVKSLGTTYKTQEGASSPLSQKYNGIASLYGATYEVDLPPDYLHLLNCICIYKVSKTYSCYDGGSYVQFAARRLTADAWSQVVNDYYNRPLPERPYFYIHNVNTSNELPTNPFDKESGKGTDMVGDTYKVTEQDGAEDDVINLPRTIKIGGKTQSLIQKNTANRYGNASKVRMEIRYGKDDSVFVLTEVLVDYIKAPQHIRLTQEQLDLTIDTSQVMEFPDYVCQEIINELVTIVMEATADPRLQTHIPVSQSVAQPAQASAQPQKQ